MKKMKTIDFIDVLDNENLFGEIIEEQYWTQEYKTREYSKLVANEAQKRNVELVDFEEFDDETFFHEMFSNYEKGLS